MAKALDEGKGVDGDMAQVVLDEIYNWIPAGHRKSRNIKTIPYEMAERLRVALETYISVCDEVDEVDNHGTGN